MKAESVFAQLNDRLLDCSLIDAFPVELLFRLWELAILERSILVLADSPAQSGRAIFALLSLTFPLRSRRRAQPYATVFDQRDRRASEGELLGATNPLFARSAAAFDGCLRLGAAAESEARARGGDWAKRLLRCRPKALIRKSLRVEGLSLNASAAHRRIDEAVARKRITALTLAFLEPLHLFLQTNPNVR